MSSTLATSVKTNAGEGTTLTEQAALELRLEAELDSLWRLYYKGGAPAIKAELIRR